MTDLQVSSMPQNFPPDFVWGVATSAFQIEGGAQLDGKGPSIWDRFCQQPHVIADASHGLVACDHYHRWQDDVKMIHGLGVDAYRFSISWPRVQPLGQGAWNTQGLDFYDRLVDALLAHNVSPSVTLNHWDLPDALQQTGGWANRETVRHFVEYAQGVARRIGDRVSALTTHNEPWVVAHLGHESGIFAPGIKNRATASQVSHHLLLSHGLALQALRADRQQAQLGIVLNLAPMHPATDSAEDQAKTKLEDGLLLRWYLDPIFNGAYPEDVLEHLGRDAPQIQSGDLAAIGQTLDFLGVNYYSRSVVSAKGTWDVKQSGLPLTDMSWEVYPQGLTELLLRLKKDYPVPPIVITENGAAFVDDFQNGRIKDTQRTSYLRQHIAAVSSAMKQGVPVVGYMVWSLMDNFEWASGYAKRFGIVHVDYETQQRTLKDSAIWYREFLTAQKAQRNLDRPAEKSLAAEKQTATGDR